MNDPMNEIYAKLAEILEVDAVAAGDVLAEFEYWDSLTVLSIIAMLDASFGVNLTAADVRRTKTAGELAAAVEERAAK
jgi:acyl carrier protein